MFNRHVESTKSTEATTEALNHTSEYFDTWEDLHERNCREEPRFLGHAVDVT